MIAARSLLLTLLLCGSLSPAIADSLYDADTFRSLTADARASQVGDAITILIVEAATAESRADTSSDSGFGIDAGIKDASGVASAGLSIDTESRGAGRTTRTGKVQAQLSARVERRLESGHLYVRGSQLILINGEQQKISVEGVVRPEDISPSNTVLSTRLSDSRIEFSGQGWVAKNQRPGLFSRLLNFFGF